MCQCLSKYSWIHLIVGAPIKGLIQYREWKIQSHDFLFPVTKVNKDGTDLGSEIAKQVAQRATIAHLSPMCQGQISFQKIQTHPSFNACSCYMKVSKGSNQIQQRKSGNTIFPIISLWGYFLDAQGQLTPWLVVRSGRNSNSFIILCMSLLPASLKKIGSISTEITW